MTEGELGGHVDPTSEISLETVKDRALKGIAVLTGRTFFLSLISLAATALLTVFLEPSEFGVFFIVSAVVNFLAYFSDIGLAASLIQKKEAVTDEDLKTTFTVQQGLVLGLLLILVVSIAPLTSFYSLSSEGRTLFFALGISFFLSSLKTIPSIILERKLEFGKLVIPQVLESIAFNLTAVTLAFLGYGIKSYTAAVLARGFVGLLAIYYLSPWLPGFAFSKKSLKKLLAFGIPYQANTLLATVKDDGLTAILGGILGQTGVGLLGWAQKWGQAPLRFFMDHVIKVTFPAFSRLQEKEKDLEQSLTKSIYFITFLVFPTLLGLLVVAPLLVSLIPRYEKWSPALLPLYLISINTIFAAVSTQLTNVLNAIGKIRITFKLMVMWTVLTYLLIPILAVKFGVVGASLGYAGVGASSVVAVVVARKFVRFSFRDSFVRPGIAALLMALLLTLMKQFLPVTLGSVWILIVFGGLSYLLFVYLLTGKVFADDVKKTLSSLFSK